MQNVLSHFHPKFRGTVKGGAAGAAIIALCAAIGLDLPTEAQDAIVALATLVGNYIASGHADSNG